MDVGRIHAHGDLRRTPVLLRSGEVAGNVFFAIKLLLIALAGLNAAVFHVTTYRDVAAWDVAAAPPPRARLAGLLSLTLWAGIISLGKLIAYARS